MKDLIRVVQQDANLKSATDENNDPGFKFDSETGTIELTLDFLVDTVIPFNNSAIKRICGKGILRRAEGYSGTMMEVGAKVDQSFEATIDGANVKSTEPTIVVKEGGTLRYKGIMKNLLLGSVNISIDPSDQPAILNQGNMVLESGSIDGAATNGGSFEYGNSMVNNNGTLTLTGGKITGGITNNKQLIIDEKAIVHLSVEYIRCEHKDVSSITIASKLLNKYKLVRIIGVHSTAPGFVPKYFYAGEIIAQGTENYQITEQDAENLIINSDFRKVIEGNKIVLREQEDADFNLQTLIDAATGTVDNPTVITIPKEGIKLSEPVTIKDRHVKLTGGTITADYSKEKYLRLLKLESGSLTLEDITIDGDKDSAAQKDSWGVLIQQQGGICNLKKGAVLQNAFGMWDFYNALIVNGGVCYMEKDARIQFNECKLGGTVAVYENGKFVLRGGYIYANRDGYNGVTTTDLQFGTVYVKGTMEFLSGEVSHDYVSIGVEGNLMYGGDGFQDAIKMLKGGVITLRSSLTKRIDLLLSNTKYRDPEVGDVIVKGTDDYKLTTSDLANFKMPEGYTLKQQDNTFVLAKKSGTSGIGSLEDLIAAVSDAPAGTADNPTVLNITTAGIDFDQTLEINGKHIKLTGNGVVYRDILTTSLCLFKISGGGSLTVEGGTISGTKDGTNAFNTAVYVSANSTLILNSVTIQKFISDLDTWSMLRIYGRCELNNCTITDNRGKAMIFIGSQGTCQITGGKIQRNNCLNDGHVSPLIYSLGTLVYYAGEYTDNHAISMQSMGTTSLICSHIQNYLSETIKNEGSFICVYNKLIHDESNIGDSFLLETDGKTRGCISLRKALKHHTLELVCHDVVDGWVAVRGQDYTLTQADLQNIVLAKALAAEYTLQMVDNTFVLKAKNSGSEKYNVTVEACKNGTLTADKTVAAKGELVTVTAKPAKGYKLYVDQLCYNRHYQLRPAANMPNTYTFNMPSIHAYVEAEFIPENIIVVSPDLDGFNPDTDVTPGKGFGNLDSLITILGGNPGEIRPEAKPVPNDELPDVLKDEIEKSEGKGNGHIGSLVDLINLVSGAKKTVLRSLPCKVRMTFYLPKSKLCASTEEGYYILNETEGKVKTIIPEYDPESNALLFETDKLGVFAVMYGSMATANEEIGPNALRIITEGDQICIANLSAGVSYSIYNLFGQVVCNGISDGSPVSHSVEKGIYIIKCGHASYKVFVR